MNDVTINRVAIAQDLFEAWDTLADVYYKKKEFLTHTETFNPCNQRYYELYENGKFSAGAIVYSLAISYFTKHINVNSPYKVTFIGTPASVSCSGLVGNKKSVDILLKRVFKLEKGIIIGLNTDPCYQIKPAISLKAYSVISMSHEFDSWDDYVSALRSSYRRRLKQLTSREDIKVVESDCRRFNKEMHTLYLNILDNAELTLETLRLNFFQNLPEKFRLTTYTHKGKIITWHINLKDESKMFFFFGGIDYTVNKKLNAYLLNLAGVVKESIEAGYKEIDFGQTAEIPKTRMGGRVMDKSMFIYHRYRLLRKIFYVIKRYVEYNRVIPEAHVFKES